MTKAPSVSVVVTCYNYGRFLGECLDSILGQTYRDFELILIDDGSTDNTGAVARQRLSDPRMRYVWQENAGQARAKNHGIRISRGQFIAFLDADDRWDVHKLERQMPRLDESGTGVVYSRALQIDEDSRQFVKPVLLGGYLTPREGRVTNHLIFDNFVPYGAAVVRRDCLDRAGIFNEDLAMAIDWDLWLRVSLICEFAYVDEPLLHHRMGHADQMSRKTDVRLRCCERILEEFVREHPVAVDARTLRRARSYALEIRGRFYRTQDKARALGYFMRALRASPLRIGIYKGIVKTILPLQGP